jgi:hypothetical protein
MIKIEDSNLRKEFINANKVEGSDDVYRDYILPKMKVKDWKGIEDMDVIHCLGHSSIKFKENQWQLGLIYENKQQIAFTHDGRLLERNITNELKGFVLSQVLVLQYSRTLGSINQAVRSLKGLAVAMLSEGLSSFSQLNDDNLKFLAQEFPHLFEKPILISSLNLLVRFYFDLPFSVNFSKQKAKELGISYLEPEQTIVVPPRIYSSMLSSFTEDITKSLPHLSQIEGETKRMIKLERNLVAHRVKQFRLGLIDLPNFVKGKSVQKLVERFEEANVVLVDNLDTDEKSPSKWIEIFNNVSPNLHFSYSAYATNKTWSYKPFKVGKKSFSTFGKFKDYLRELDMKAKMVCLCLSGMRTDELHSMHPAYGAQSYEYNGNTIHLFTTRQSKITKGIQTEEDVFVTTKAGHDAFKLLTTIHRPLLVGDIRGFGNFASIKMTLFPISLSKEVWRCDFQKSVNKWLESSQIGVLNAEDVSFLRLASSSTLNKNEGEVFHFTPHQTRRTFAFYIVGLELMAFPQLKQQLSHLCSAMTRYYANNATYWGTLRLEVKSEELRQKSNLLASVYQRLANKERIAGGKGKLFKTLTSNSNFFEEDNNSRMLNPAYWEKMIQSGKSHIHAIAPGMYCTNSQCDMRINVTLEECVDCEFDVIMDGMYAEGKRMNASRNLAILDEQNEITHSVASQLVMQIKSCEAILSDLGIPFDEVQIPLHVSEMLIKTVAI